MLDTSKIRTDETPTDKIRTEGMPADMRVLLADYPRDDWSAHPGFRDKTQHWLQAHQMFRRVSDLLVTETQSYLDRAKAPEEYAARLSHYGGGLVQSLHGHHGWEDHSYFPELSAADPRFDAGLAILEADHKVLDGVLDRFARAANRVIQLVQLDEAQARTEAGDVLAGADTIKALLDRHLADEEDLAVPIILHHRLRG